MGIAKFIINKENGGGGGGGAANLSVAISYSELKDLRDGNGLVPGMWYRINDYLTTIPANHANNVQSAGHQFDVIVRADDKSRINENAFAAPHEGEDYFAGCMLEAWQLKYCIDNDIQRFDLGGPGAKGVIYWMRDEFGNEAPYDFKNIMFQRPLTNGHYDPDNGNTAFVYTFNIFQENLAADATVAQAAAGAAFKCYGNQIKAERDTHSKIMLGKNVFLITSSTTRCSGNCLGPDCHDNTFEDASDNQLGNGCYGIVIREGGIANTLEAACKTIEIGQSCANIHFGSECAEITLEEHCRAITIHSKAGRFTVGGDSINCQILSGSYGYEKINFATHSTAPPSGRDRQERSNCCIFPRGFRGLGRVRIEAPSSRWSPPGAGRRGWHTWLLCSSRGGRRAASRSMRQCRPSASR